MKKSFLAYCLAAAVLLSVLISASADTSGISFTAVGDNLEPLNHAPSYSGGVTYVPASVFSAFGVYLNYFDSDATALLYNGSKQIFFNMTDGGASDSLGTEYEVSAIFKGGQVYVPVSWVCVYFGLSYSYISGNGNGDIVRIKNGTEVLTDKQFLDSTSLTMKYYYNEYYGTTATPTPSPGVSPSPGAEDEDHSSTYIFLSFVGMPDGKLLDSLSRFAYSASFFVTEEQAKAQPDMLRRIYGSGHNIGIYCSASAEECVGASEAVFGACQVLPTLMTSAEAIAAQCQSYGGEHGLSYFIPSIYADGNTETRSSVTSSLESAPAGYIGLTVDLSETTQKMLPSLLSYFSAEGYSVVPLRETYL